MPKICSWPALQDMAIPVLAKVLPSEYGQLLERRGEDNRRLSQLERERFGWTHADAAARLAIEWNLPENSPNCYGSTP